MAKEYRAPGSPQSAREQRPPAGAPKYKWAFHGAPISAPGGAVPFMVPEEIAEDLSRHLERLSFWERQELLDLADENGMLDVRSLPERTIRHDPPPEGPLEWFNPGPWVPVSAPEPSTRVQIDPTTITDAQAREMEQERREIEEALRRREAMKRRYAEADPHVRGEAR